MNNQKKILVIDAYTDSNIGSCALVENSLFLIRNKYPKAEIKLMAHYPKAFEGRYDVEVVNDIFHYPFLKKRYYQYLWLFYTLNWMLLVYLLPIKIVKNLFSKKVNDFLWADWVISIGAERINDKYIKTALFSEYIYKIVKRFKKRMVLFPCSIGPFIYHGTKNIFKNVANSIDIIYTRDMESYNISKAIINNPKLNLINTCDVAVFQKWEDRKILLSKIYGKQIIGISVMKWTYFANKYETPYSNYSSYVHEMVKLIDALIKQYNVHITLFPTNFQINGGLGDDLSVAYEIFEKIEDKKNVNILNNLVSPFEFKSLLSASEINITTRMHACILSTGAFVPTISINYLFKIREYMNSINLSNYSLDIEDFEHSIILNMFNAMWGEREYLKNQLQKSIDNNKLNLMSALEYLDYL